MTTKKIPAFLLAAAVFAASLPVAGGAGVPRKQPVGRYAALWNDSPFTVKPVEEGPKEPEAHPVDDYTLAGVAEMDGGWFVVLMNKKKRDDRVRIKPGVPNEQGFQVTNVKFGDGYKDTQVEVMAGGRKTWVAYEDKFLVLQRPPAAGGGKKPAPAAVKRPPAKPATPQQVRKESRSSSRSRRPPRIRRIPTPKK